MGLNILGVPVLSSPNDEGLLIGNLLADLRSAGVIVVGDLGEQVNALEADNLRLMTRDLGLLAPVLRKCGDALGSADLAARTPELNVNHLASQSITKGHRLLAGLARTRDEPAQTFQLLIERRAIGRLRLVSRRWCAEQRSIVGHAATLTIFGDHLCAVIPQTACAALLRSGTKHLLDTRVGRHLWGQRCDRPTHIARLQGATRE
jgi:hypothetical protein